MEKNKKTEEILSRREFFKKAAKGTLPILGAVMLAGTPVIGMGKTSSSTCNGSCTDICQNSCSGGCYRSCVGSCQGGCQNTCKGRCYGSCYRSSSNY